MSDAAAWERHSQAQCADFDGLFATLYQDLCRLARREVRCCGAQDVLGTGTLVHEAWLDFRNSSGLAFPGPGQFLTYASRMMRGLAIDRLRTRQAQRNGGGAMTPLDTAAADAMLPMQDWQPLRDSLADLESMEPALSQVVDLRFFCGFTMAEIARMQGVSERTVQRQWEKARGLLFGSLRL